MVLWCYHNRSINKNNKSIVVQGVRFKSGKKDIIYKDSYNQGLLQKFNIL